MSKKEIAIRLLSAPESQLAASTKPGLAGLIILGVLWFIFGVPVIILMLSAFVVASSTHGKVEEGILLLLVLINYGAGVIGLVVVYQAHREWAKRNDMDYSASQAIGERLRVIGARMEPLSDRSSDMRIIQGANVGEISPHFDQRVSASISGWFHHELGLHGWGVGGSVGKVGISGASRVDLDVSGVMRDNLGGDGFIAVFEQDQPNGMIDTIRIIVPSDPACREYIAQLLPAIGATFGTGSHVDATFRRYAPQLAVSFPCDVSHVSDQLRAILRQPLERRPTVTVVGEDLGGAAILGGAIRFGVDGSWQQLFPLSLNRAILASAEGLAGYAGHNRVHRD